MIGWSPLSTFSITNRALISRSRLKTVLWVNDVIKFLEMLRKACFQGLKVSWSLVLMKSNRTNEMWWTLIRLCRQSSFLKPILPRNTLKLTEITINACLDMRVALILTKYNKSTQMSWGRSSSRNLSISTTRLLPLLSLLSQSGRSPRMATFQRLRNKAST